jgi:hypothetical protein
MILSCCSENPGWARMRFQRASELTPKDRERER